VAVGIRLPVHWGLIGCVACRGSLLPAGSPGAGVELRYGEDVDSVESRCQGRIARLFFGKQS